MASTPPLENFMKLSGVIHRKKLRSFHRIATEWRTNVSMLTAIWLLSLCSLAKAQVQDIYRIGDSRFATHGELVPLHVDLKPGESMVLGDLTGPGKVTYFYYTDNGADRMYPGLILEVYWDDAPKPSIAVPLWNFFGAFDHKIVDYQSLLMQINHYCLMSYLPMPFSKRARFVLVNDGDEIYSRAAAWGIDYEKNRIFERETSRLHAAWRRSRPGQNKDALHTMLEIVGRGQYIGNFLQVNTDYEGWWGEGNTTFEVDGETLTHSPGTEDEYGSTWGFGHTFSYPYSGYIQMDVGQNRMYRWYFANPVHFSKSLRVQVQDQRSQAIVRSRSNGGESYVDYQQVNSSDESDEFTSVVFWYQEGAQPAPPIPCYRERIRAKDRTGCSIRSK